MVDVSKLKVGDRFILVKKVTFGVVYPTSNTFTIREVLTCDGVPVSVVASCPYTARYLHEFAIDALADEEDRLKLIDPTPAAAPTDGAE